MTWLKRANCAGTDPELFYIEKGEPEMHKSIKAAMRVCLGCEVKRECLIECASSGENWRYGIWAGTTVGSRKRIDRLSVLDGTYDFSLLDSPMSYSSELTDLVA